MQRLADELALSPGNVTYHFPKKEDLMLAIYERFQDEMREVIPEAENNLASISVIDEQITAFYQLQQRFLFFYLDLLEIERSYRQVAERHYRHIENQITAIEFSLLHNMQLGYLRKREHEEDYKTLAEQLWLTAVFWPTQCRVRGKKDRIEELRHALWSQIKPFVTKAGKNQLEAIFSNQKHTSKII